MGRRPTLRTWFVVGGLVLGLTWGTALRAWMTLLVVAEADQARYEWWPTFVLVLVPPALIGAAVGWAEAVRRDGDGPHRRHLVWAPLVFVLVPALAQRGFLSRLAAEGTGGGAVIVLLLGVVGAYGFSGRGPRVPRYLAALAAVGTGLTFASFAAVRLEVPARLEALPAMLGAMFALLMAVMVAAVARGARGAPTP